MQRAVYRIIDANFNRGREGLRVIEEYCRFALESADLSARAKTLRHRLCDAVAKLDAGALAACRDSQADVGRGMRVDNQMTRGDLRDCCTAAAKRLPEALRVLAETVQTLDPVLSQVFEELRFTFYTLEKDIVLAGDAAEKFGQVRLYVLITALPDTSDAKVLDTAIACARGGADCLQLRAKGIDDDRAFRLACEMVRICAEHDIVSIINDRTDIAVAAGTDGVHLGQNDVPLREARKLQQKPMIFGISTHSVEQLGTALTEKPDYVAIGPVFATDTKPHEPCVGLRYVAEAMEVLKGRGTGHVAIGGITLENVDEVVKTGVQAVAVCAAITAARDPREQCRRFKENILLLDR